MRSSALWSKRADRRRAAHPTATRRRCLFHALTTTGTLPFDRRIVPPSRADHARGASLPRITLRSYGRCAVLYSGVLGRRSGCGARISCPGITAAPWRRADAVVQPHIRSCLQAVARARIIFRLPSDLKDRPAHAGPCPSPPPRASPHLRLVAPISSITVLRFLERRTGALALRRGGCGAADGDRSVEGERDSSDRGRWASVDVRR